MSALYLSRATLRREPSVATLARVLLPDEVGARAYAAHRLIWSLFTGEPDSTRDFLFRSDAPEPLLGTRGRFLVLSRRPPNADHPLLEVECKAFEPDLRKGDRLAFSLRANATRTRRTADGETIRVDVVMDALPKRGERAEARPNAIRKAGSAWLDRQGERSGFRLAALGDGEAQGLEIDGYELWRFAGLGQKGKIATLDFQGLLEVTDPDLFMRKLAEGFGRAKAFGCGLMLIRRV